MKILIIRHAEPDYSIDSLTEKGRREAELLSERLCKLDIKAFYVSPLGRAKDTAAHTLQKLGRTAEEKDWLKEFWPKISRPDRENAVAWDWLPEDWTKLEEFYSRNDWGNVSQMKEAGVYEAYRYVTDSFDELLASHGYKRKDGYYEVTDSNEDTIVFFCHFGLECVLLSRLLNISPVLIWHGFCAVPSSVTTLISEERRKGAAYFRMNGFGDISHLYAGDEEPSFMARFCETYDNFDQRH